MKAKRLKDGAIIEVTTKYTIAYAGGVCFYDEDGEFYSLSDLDFSLSEPEEEVTIEGFVERDPDGWPRLYAEYINYLLLPRECNIKGEVTITIKPKKK